MNQCGGNENAGNSVVGANAVLKKSE